jgi:ribosome biogenesis GTPase
LKQGLVVKSTGSWYTVKDEEGNRYECKIKGNLRLKGLKTTNPVAVGDQVSFEYREKDSKDQNRPVGLIFSIEE